MAAITAIKLNCAECRRGQPIRYYGPSGGFLHAGPTFRRCHSRFALEKSMWRLIGYILGVG